jgi:hypothetical protein
MGCKQEDKRMIKGGTQEEKTKKDTETPRKREHKGNKIRKERRIKRRKKGHTRRNVNKIL